MCCLLSWIFLLRRRCPRIPWNLSGGDDPLLSCCRQLSFCRFHWENCFSFVVWFGNTQMLPHLPMVTDPDRYQCDFPLRKGIRCTPTGASLSLTMQSWWLEQLIISILSFSRPWMLLQLPKMVEWLPGILMAVQHLVLLCSQHVLQEIQRCDRVGGWVVTCVPECAFNLSKLFPYRCLPDC